MVECYNCLTKFSGSPSDLTVKMGAPAVVYRICPDCRKCVECNARVNPGDLCVTLAFSNKIPAVLFFCPRHKEVGVRMIGLKPEEWPEDVCRKVKGYLVERRESMVQMITKDPQSSASQRLVLMNGFLGVLDDRLKGTHLAQQAVGQGITREIVTREIVKIPCKYCGAFLVVTESKCPNCGAPVLR